MPFAHVVHQTFVAKVSCFLFNFMRPFKDCTGAEIKQRNNLKAAKGVVSAAENEARVFFHTFRVW